MHRLAIGQNDDAEPAVTGFFYAGPAANEAVRLYALALWMFDYPGNPGIADSRAVAPTPDHFEIFCRFHFPEVTTLHVADG